MNQPGLVREHADGSPFQPGDFVRVVDAIDQDIYDVSTEIGRFGRVEGLDYDSGLGQEYPDDPFVAVEFPGGHCMYFWPEELSRVSTRAARQVRA